MYAYRRDESYFLPLWICSGTKSRSFALLVTKARYNRRAALSPRSIFVEFCSLSEISRDWVSRLFNIRRTDYVEISNASSSSRYTSLIRFNSFTRYVARFRSVWLLFLRVYSVVFALSASHLQFFLSTLEWLIDE